MNAIALQQLNELRTENRNLKAQLEALRLKYEPPPITRHQQEILRPRGACL
jgi:hypothetical protein